MLRLTRLTCTEDRRQRSRSQNQRSRKIFSLRELMPRTQRVSRLWRLPLGPNIRKSHLVILGKTCTAGLGQEDRQGDLLTLLRGSVLWSSSLASQLTASRPYWTKDPPRNLAIQLIQCCKEKEVRIRAGDRRQEK